MNTIRKKLDSLYGEYNHLQRKESEEEELIQTLENHVANVEESQKLVQSISKEVQETAHKKIADIVTKCLKEIFGKQAYEFRIVFEQKRGKTEARLLFYRNGEEIDPITSSGGGVIDIAAFALRLSCLLLSQKRKLLILDEPFRFLSKEYRPKIRKLLESLSEKMGIQIIMVTHIRNLQIGKVYHL